MHRAGQLITLRKKVYRVKKAEDGITCDACAFSGVPGDKFPCDLICLAPKAKMPMDCYLKEITVTKILKYGK